ncbi:hypothetical protein OKA04_21040 [Luteolibacter flavescens]|uniref:DUF1444 family protein n=1 Tax=Luteolibacter flavescens TaxID=1859460 RepID=A0ABT3FUL0_9BACT|nr:hypothetical protein [Luteolibacter flavescens]MCW1887237.1 hypothetical protein [Luteolibacter flavescens]
MDVRERFEDELRSRGVAFTIDPESMRHSIKVGDGQLLVSLENLQRDVKSDGDIGRISRFVDAVLAASPESDTDLSADRLFWSLEPNDYEECAEIREALSDRVDRVLVHVSSDDRLISWVTADMLDTLVLSEIEAGERAFENLAKALESATFQVSDIDGVPLGYLETTLPFKAALLLAPNLKDVLGPRLGWPLLAVVPDRDFIYLWAAEHVALTGRLGRVVVREYSNSAYPVSTEVYEASDQGIRAIGAFPVG